METEQLVILGWFQRIGLVGDFSLAFAAAAAFGLSGLPTPIINISPNRGASFAVIQVSLAYSLV